MFNRLRPRFDHATIVAYLALFVALGGVAYGVATGSIDSRELKNNTIRGKDVRDNGLTGKDVKALTGADIDESSLGTVPTATHADTATSAGRADIASSLVAPEPFREVGATNQPAFQNSCANVLGNTERVGFFKDREGVVHLKGAYSGCSTPGAIAFQLPAGYRPADSRGPVFPLAGDATTFVEVIGSGFGAATDGGVRCAASICRLDGITFRAAS